MSRERKELFGWNKKHPSKFLKGYHLVKKYKIDKKQQTQQALNKIWDDWHCNSCVDNYNSCINYSCK